MLDKLLQQKLKKREEDGLLRKLPASNNLIDFSSNDYLGLSRSIELSLLIRDKIESLNLNKNGSTGSRLLSGNSTYAEEIESTLSQVFKTEAALIFNSGYAANQGVLSSIPQRGDTVLYDELSHACIKDGIRLSTAQKFSFKHNDVDDLERKIKKNPGRVFIVIESIYSMDGDEAPLKDIIELKKRYGAAIILDEAHSTGITGENGGGLAISQGLHHEVDIRIHTFGKAMGIHGACVVGSTIAKQYLINFARPFIYTTSLPPHSLASIDCAFNFLAKRSQLQILLNQKIDLYKKLISDFKNKTKSNRAIQTLICPGNDNAKRIAARLQSRGFDVRPILSPTVPPGQERLRICLHTFNTDEEIMQLSSAINELN